MKNFLAFVCLGLFAVALTLTAGERKGAGYHQYGTSATDEISFHGATPIPMASAAAQASVSPAAISPTAIPTLTPAVTPVGSALDPAIAQINLLTAQVNKLTTLTNRLQKDLKDKGLIKGGP